MFESAFRKVERAYTHIKRIEGAIVRLSQSNKADFMVNKDPDTDTQFIHYNIGNPIPPDLPLILGDAIHNLRTALDHAMWEFLGIPGGTQDPSASFPFSKTKIDYEAACKGIKTTFPNTEKFFISIEAYETGKGKYLYGLNRLNILDKHKILTPVVNLAEIEQIKIVYQNGKTWSHSFGKFPISPDGIARIPIGIPIDCIVQCYNNAKPTVEVEFGKVDVFEKFPLFETLIELYTVVKSTLFDFRDFVATRP